MNARVTELKRRCPMPVLLEKMGLGQCARKRARSPFREDKNPSWGIFERNGAWSYKDQATGESGDEIALLALWKGWDEKRDFRRILNLYEELAGMPLSGGARQRSSDDDAPEPKLFSWSSCTTAFSPAESCKLAEWRGYSREFCEWLRAENLIGLHDGHWALPVHSEGGAVLACHYRVDRRDGQRPVWKYFPEGIGTRPLTFGDMTASCAFVFESPWDAFAVMDRLGWHRPKGIPDTAVLVTRGAGNGKLVGGLFTPRTALYAFKQNDTTNDGKNAADKWLTDVCNHAAGRVYHVATPSQFKDVNDWTRAGATGAAIMEVIQDAKLVFEPMTFRDTCGGRESVENVENCSQSASLGPAVSPLSTFSTGQDSLSKAVYAENSWLARYMDLARQREESADSYLLGAILPVVGAALRRQVRFPWGEGAIYPNLFTMLAGKPGDRKSSAINLAERMARAALSMSCFLPDSLSVEALFDEYDEGSGGCADKLLIADDANPFLGLLRRSNYGERVGDLLLRLFDCKGLDESFRRNKTGENPSARRHIAETSTSICFGATFNVCQFQGHEIRTGLQRRFNYYLAEGHGRFLVLPARSDPARLLAVTAGLQRLASLPNTDCAFTPEASELWEIFQRENRRQLAPAESTPESQLARLNGQPTHVLKLSMIFQAALWAETSDPFSGLIDRATLETAIQHSNHCITAAQALDAIGNRASIQSDADVLLANIQRDFEDKNIAGEIVLTRTDLTSRYAHHSGRRGALSPEDLYLRLIPDLIRRRKAKEVPRPGKQSSFAFKVEEDE